MLRKDKQRRSKQSTNLIGWGTLGVIFTVYFLVGPSAAIKLSGCALALVGVFWVWSGVVGAAIEASPNAYFIEGPVARMLGFVLAAAGVLTFFFSEKVGLALGLL